MPLTNYQYYGQAFGVDANITNPGPEVYSHGGCGLPNGTAAHPTGNHPGYIMAHGLSHGAVTSDVNAMAEDPNGFFRTEIHVTINDLHVDGLSILHVDQINFGMVSVYRRAWYDGSGPAAKLTRSLPMDCSFVNPTLNGAMLAVPLPAPFLYSVSRRETYLAADTPDPTVDADILQAISGSSSRVITVPNFGSIFYGEWTLLPRPGLNPITQMFMLRMAFSSPPSGGGTGGGGQGDGTGG